LGDKRLWQITELYANSIDEAGYGRHDTSENLDVIMVSQIALKYSANIKVRPAGEDRGDQQGGQLIM
jgi:hypothetical protein